MTGSAAICLITGAHLCRNPRVVKEAEALSAAGFRVVVLGPVFTEQLAAEDRAITDGADWQHVITADLSRPGLRSITHRMVRRLGREAVARCRFERPEALGYAVRSVCDQARRIGADFYIGHQELGLWVVDQLARENRNVGVDLEDWYSEDLLPEARVHRPRRLLRRLEAAALRRGGHLTTTSAALAQAMVRELGGTQPVAIYNAFSWCERDRLDGMVKDRRNLNLPSLHWVSQTIGPGRSLEMLCVALQAVNMPVEVHLRGNCSTAEEGRLRTLFPRHRGHVLYVHPLVPPAQLLSRIAEHDVGLALEPDHPPNRQYTVTNKILHYLLAGVAVVATDTVGQREIAAVTPEGVRLCRADDPCGLAAVINQLLASPAALLRAKQAALESARSRFSWEHQVPVLVESVERAVGRFDI